MAALLPFGLSDMNTEVRGPCLALWAALRRDRIFDLWSGEKREGTRTASTARRTCEANGSIIRDVSSGNNSFECSACSLRLGAS